MNLREHNELTDPMHKALMQEHSDDWDMQTVREAALICSNTLLPIVQAREAQASAKGAREAITQASERFDDQVFRHWGVHGDHDDIKAAIFGLAALDDGEDQPNA